LTMLVSILFNLMSDYVFTSLKGGRSFQWLIKKDKMPKIYGNFRFETKWSKL
jgi:hypothetical protein